MALTIEQLEYQLRQAYYSGAKPNTPIVIKDASFERDANGTNYDSDIDKFVIY